MPIAERNSAFEYVTKYANKWGIERSFVTRDDTKIGADAGVGGVGGDTDSKDKSNTSAIIEYSQAASVHGLKYVWARNRSKYSRMVWALFFLAMFAGLSVTLFFQLQEMSAYPTLTKQLIVIESEIVFPSVTICNLNQFRKSIVENNSLIQYVLTRISDVGLLFGVINFTDPIWHNATNATISPKALAQLLNSAPHPLNDSLVTCQWRHEQRPCSELFKTVVTDFGVCYSFNTHEIEKEQRKSDLFGNMYGLSLVMNTNQPEYILSQWNMPSGFRVLLHGFYETPRMIEKGFIVGPGSSYFAKISAHKMSFLPAPFKAFRDTECTTGIKTKMSGYLRHFPAYDRGACFLECQINYTYGACGCRGLYDPVDHLPFCDLHTLLTCYLPSFKEFRENSTLRNACICPVACQLQSYEVSLSMASYPSQIFMDMVNNSLQPPEHPLTREFYRTNYLELHLYYDNSQTVSIEQFPQYTFESIMSLLGGQMGIFLGASLISVLEFLEFVVCTVVSRIKVAKDTVGKLNTIPVRQA